MSPPSTHDSAVLPCFHGCLDFLHQHFPPWSPPSHPLNWSLCSQQQPSPWDCFTIPKLHLPASVPSRRPPLMSGVCMAAARTVWFSFHLDCCRSAVSFSALNVSPLTQTIAPMWNWTPPSVPPPTEGRSSPTNTPVFPPSSFILPSFAWFYIFFSPQSGTPVHSQLVFCMHFCVWRCIPDVSVERDVLHVHLLLHHLVLLKQFQLLIMFNMYVELGCITMVTQNSAPSWFTHIIYYLRNLI